MVHVLVAVLDGLVLDDGACLFRRFGLVSTCSLSDPFTEQSHSNHITKKYDAPSCNRDRPCVVVRHDHLLITSDYIQFVPLTESGMVPFQPFPQRCGGITPIDSC